MPETQNSNPFQKYDDDLKQFKKVEQAPAKHRRARNTYAALGAILLVAGISVATTGVLAMTNVISFAGASAIMNIMPMFMVTLGIISIVASAFPFMLSKHEDHQASIKDKDFIQFCQNSVQSSCGLKAAKEITVKVESTSKSEPLDISQEAKSSFVIKNN